MTVLLDFFGGLFSPFIEFGFMRRALIGCLALSLGAAPVGVFLMLRRMSLAGDAISHAILPGAAIGYLFAGLSIWAMTIGGLVAGILVALCSGSVARNSVIKEETSLATFYLISLSMGVLIISTQGSNIDLLHVLFGSVLALDNASLILLASFASFSLVLITAGLRLIVLECYDPSYLARVSKMSAPTHYGFMILVVLNLIGGFHALGTLMAVGIMILPAAAARLWTKDIISLLLLAVAIAFTGSFAGLLFSYYVNAPAGAAIILTLGGCYVLSIIFAPYGPLLGRLRPSWHFEH